MADESDRFPGIFYDVPEHTREPLKRWIKEGRIPGAFLLSVLENDLRGAVCRADPQNAARLLQIVQFLNMEAPAPCWGSRENVAAWALRFALEREQALTLEAQRECLACGQPRGEHSQSRACEGFRKKG